VRKDKGKGSKPWPKRIDEGPSAPRGAPEMREVPKPPKPPREPGAKPPRGKDKGRTDGW